jgi:hypothetical protein
MRWFPHSTSLPVTVLPMQLLRRHAKEVLTCLI